MTRLDRIDLVIKRCSDRKQLNLLNRAWWKEFFRVRNYTVSEWVQRMRELRIGVK